MTLVPNAATWSSLSHSDPGSQEVCCLHLLMLQDTQSLQGTLPEKMRKGGPLLAGVSQYGALSSLLTCPPLPLPCPSYSRKRTMKIRPRPLTVTSSPKTTMSSGPRSGPSCLCVSLGLGKLHTSPFLWREVPSSEGLRSTIQYNTLSAGLGIWGAGLASAGSASGV